LAFSMLIGNTPDVKQHTQARKGAAPPVRGGIGCFRRGQRIVPGGRLCRAPGFFAESLTRRNGLARRQALGRGPEKKRKKAR